MLRLFFDGLCEPMNPGGLATYGFVVYETIGLEQKKLFEDHGPAMEPGSESTHNLAEYTGLIKGLEWILANNEDKRLSIWGVSQVVIYQLTGAYKVRSEKLMPFHERAISLLEGCDWCAKWVPREENSVANALSEKAYEEYWVKKTGRVPPTMRQRGAIE